MTTLKKNMLPLAALLFAFALPVQADQGFYLGAGYANTDFNDSNFDDSIDQFGLRAGYMFTENFGIDLTSAMTSSATNGLAEAEVGVFAINGIVSVPLGEYFDLYGKLGGARVKTKSTFGNSTITEDSSTELFWGVGGKVDFGVVNLFLEYNRFDTDLVDINTAMAGVLFEF